MGEQQNIIITEQTALCRHTPEKKAYKNINFICYFKTFILFLRQIQENANMTITQP